jgi:hypothetical protein
MSKHEREAIYREAWSLYYTHKICGLCSVAWRQQAARWAAWVLLTFATTVRLEICTRFSDASAGILRLRHPSEHRPGLRESIP